MEKIINIGGKDVTFKTNGATPIKYRNIFHSDMLMEMQKLNFTEESDSMILLQVAYAAMIGFDKPPYEEWLESLELYELTELMDAIADMWVKNETQAQGDLEPKK